jgi:hypothetical protein
MSAARKVAGLTLHWWVALAAGVAVVVPALMLFRLPHGQPAADMPAAPSVQLTSFAANAGQSLLQQQAEFFDPTPLFLPTSRNSSQRELPASVQRHPGEIANVYASPKLSFNEAALSLPLGPPVSLPTGPREILARDGRDPFFTFGREDVALPTLKPRGAHAEVRVEKTGELVLDQDLTSANPPRTDWAGGLQPLEYIAAIDRAGLIGPLVLTMGSGSDEVDAYFRDYLARDFRVGERLAPGFYRVLVGP